MKKLICLVTIFAVLFTGCFGTGTFGGEKLNVESEEIQFKQPEDGDITATLKTSEGEIKILLFPEYAPKAVENFVSLSQNGTYNGMIINRAIENFIVQTGSPDGSLSGGESIWGIEFEDEFTDKLHHYNGAVSMANHGEDTNGSQFFFVTGEIGKISEDTENKLKDAEYREDVISAYKQAGGNPAFDYRYTVFGQIYEGLDVAYKISRAKTDEKNRPTKDIIIETVEINTVGQAEQTEE